ncbi:hypothetical protein K456DRAFT_751275 [Colletotrichum gloeosporioides 23]|nr:hypothetical protein K456DRAFT_751275 [Colletotrichum gloeosporioides 23]
MRMQSHPLPISTKILLIFLFTLGHRNPIPTNPLFAPPPREGRRCSQVLPNHFFDSLSSLTYTILGVSPCLSLSTAHAHKQPSLDRLELLQYGYGILRTLRMRRLSTYCDHWQWISPQSWLLSGVFKIDKHISRSLLSGVLIRLWRSLLPCCSLLPPVGASS